MNEEPSRQVVEQRIRNRVIETLEEVCEARTEADLLSQYDFINDAYQWLGYPGDDQMPTGHPYNTGEIEALHQFKSALDALCGSLPRNFEVEVMMAKREWVKLREAAHIALAEMMKRGRMSEEEEVN